MAGTFPLPDINSSYTITHRNFVRIGDKKFLEINHVHPPPLLYNFHYVDFFILEEIAKNQKIHNKKS
jgi:hypothetical protein